MAISLSLSNFSFLLPTNPPPRPTLSPLQLSFISPQTHSNSNFVSLVSQSHSNDSSLSPELASVTNPAFTNANIMFFRSAYNVQVIVDENEPEERLLNRFRREVMKAGVVQECKRRRFFENKQDKEKRKSREAAKRNRRRRPQSRSGPPSKREEPTAKKDDDDKDNWDLPGGNLPY